MYRQLIDSIVTGIRGAGHGIDPRWVEAYMRLEHSTLDGLSRMEFFAEVKICLECIDSSGPENAEALAESMGLLPERSSSCAS